MEALLLSQHKDDTECQLIIDCWWETWQELRKGSRAAGPPTGRNRAAAERGTQGRKKSDAFGRPYNGRNIGSGRSYDQMDPAGKRLENASRQLNKLGRKVQRGEHN
jgi:hypothetical protein